jgi:hypothetical protein
MDQRETLIEISKLDRSTDDKLLQLALHAYDVGCNYGHGPYKSIAWDFAVEAYRRSGLGPAAREEGK